MNAFQKNVGLFALLRATVVPNLLFALLFRFADVNSRDLVSVLVVVNIQILIGGLIWVGLGTRPSIDISEFIGMGGALGFGLSLLSSQVLRTVIPFSISWLVFPILLLSALQLFNGYSIGYSLSKVKASNELFLLFSGTLIALSTSWYWLISSAVAVFFWVVLHYWRVSNRESGTSYSKHQSVLLVVAVLVSIRAFVDLSSLSEIRHPLWWNLRFGIMQDRDSIFYESMMQSAKNLGNGRNIFFNDLEFFYHWFSFAWESTLGALSTTKPFVITTIVGPSIVILVVLCLTFTIAKQASSYVFSGPIAVFVVAMMCAGPIPFLRVLHPYSFSFNFALIFIYGIVVVLSIKDFLTTVNFVSVIFFLSFCLAGSKVTFIPLLATGIFCSAFYQIRLGAQALKFISACIGVFFALVIASVMMYSLGAQSGASYKLSFADILWQKVNLEQHLPFSVVLVSFCATVVLLLAPAMSLLISKNVFKKDEYIQIVFSIVAGLCGIVLGFILSDPSESNAYFLQAGLALLVPLSVTTAMETFRTIDLRTRKYLLVFICFCLEIARWWPRWYRNVAGEGFGPFYKTSLILAIPILMPLLFALVAIFFLKHEIKMELIRIGAILLIAISAGSYYANAGDFFSKGQWAAKNVRFTFFETISGSEPYRELLLWLRDNSLETDLLATNRYCSLSTDVPPNCPASWNLTSAITGRQMLNEGTWTTDIIFGMGAEREKRRLLTSDFVDSPSEAELKELIRYGVTWVVADFAVTKTRNWGSFASVRFENQAGAILELSQTN